MKAKEFNPASLGSRVRIAAVSTVCAYLHGATGTIVEFRYNRTDGCTNAIVKLDEPRKPTEHWSPITHMGLSVEQFEVLPEEQRP